MTCPVAERSKGALVSALDSIAGFGPARRHALLHRFGSLEGIRKATLEELLSLPGMTRPVAERLQDTSEDKLATFDFVLAVR